MICAYCGHTNEQGGNFCARCGAQLMQDKQPAYTPNAEEPTFDPEPPIRPRSAKTASSQKMAGSPESAGSSRLSGYGRAVRGIRRTAMKSPLMKILMFAVPAVIVVVAAIVIISLLGGSGSAMRKNHIAFFSDSGETIVSGNNNAKFTLDGGLESFQISLDGSKAVALTDYDFRTGGTLWFVTASGGTHIADDVFAYQLADSGNGVAYFTDHDARNELAALYLYDTSNNRATLLTDAAYYDGYGYMPGVAISPNGKSVGYIADYDARNFEFAGYIRIDGKAAEKLGDEMFAVAISDGGRHLYFCKLDVRTREASLHVRSGRNENRLVPDVGNVTIMLNRDYSEIIYSVHDGDHRTFISRNGSERERISGAAISSILVPRGAQVRTHYNDFSNITVYGMSSLSNFTAITDEGIAYYNNRLEANRIAASSDYSSGAEISGNGKTLYYINNSMRLSSIDPTVPGAERREIDRDVVSFTSAGDGRSVYYVNDENELLYVSGSGAPVRIADDVAHSGLSISHSGNRLFFLVEYRSGRGGELFFSNNGGRRTKVSGADDVLSVWSTPTNIFFVTRDSELFRSNGNDNFSMFHEDIDWR